MHTAQSRNLIYAILRCKITERETAVIFCMISLSHPRASAEIFQEGANEKNTKNSKKTPKNRIIKPLSTISVTCMKIQGGHGPPAPCCRRPCSHLYCLHLSLSGVSFLVLLLLSLVQTLGRGLPSVKFLRFSIPRKKSGKVPQQPPA